MNCSACGRANLPGGLRCAYCGELLPPTLDFHVEAPAAAQQSSASASPASAGGKAGCLVSLGLLALKWKSLITLLQFGKLAAMFASMAAFIWIDAKFFGWRLAVGLALCILVHEFGHVLANKLRGIASSAPIFIPGFGALITVKSFPDDPTAEADCGAGGPAAGGLAAFVCLGIAIATGSTLFYAVALLAFIMNLFNLIPVSPLDGGRMASVFSPGVWTGVLLILLAVALKASMPVLWLLLIAAFIGKLRHADSDRHNLAAPMAKLRMGAIYLALCIGLSWGVTHSMAGRALIDQEIGQAAAFRQTQTAAPSDAAEAPEPASPQAQRELPPAVRAIVLVMGIAVLLSVTILPFALWIAAALILRRPSGDARGWQAFRMLLLPMLSTAVALGSGYLWPAAERQSLSLALAAIAAAASAFANSIYQANRHAASPGTPMALQANCLGWGAGAALAVAYGMDSWVVAGGVLVCALLFYRVYPWVASHLLANLRVGLGDAAGALRCLTRAIEGHPEAASLPELHAAVARLNLRLQRGAGALPAIDAVQATVPGTPDTVLARITALALLHRFDEAVAGCEQLLSEQVGAIGAPQRLYMAHLALARIALLRGWHDEALAQVDWCIGAAPSKASTLVATLRLLRAEALCGLGRPAAALAECQTVAKISRSPEVEGWSATIRTECLLQQGGSEEALKESGRAMLLAPGALPALYWRGKALLANGRASEGMDILRTLATDWRNDHWGRQAQAV